MEAKNQYYIKNKEKMNTDSKLYYATHKEIANERSRLWYQKNKEYAKRKKLEYAITHKDGIKLYEKKRLEQFPEKVALIRKKADLKKLYGITLDEYNELLKSQNDRCAICKSKEVGRKDCKYFSVDHDHKTGKVRGLLCTRCNKSLGMLYEDVEIFKNAIKYLRKHKNG